MNLKQFIERETYVALHAQTWKFRAVKYIVLIALATVSVIWKGWQATGILFLVLFAAAIAIHFLFRWKSKGWTQDWGPYKKLNLPK